MTQASASPGTGGAPGYDVEAVRKDFPALDRLVHGDRPLVYLDSAATSQKPRAVLEAVEDFYLRHNANVHRGVHTLAEEATGLYEQARDSVARFINAPDRDTVVFTKNSTEAINLVAFTMMLADPPYRVGPGDEILVTEMEHHSNLVPWQLLAQRTGARLRWLGITDSGRLDLSRLDELLTPATTIVAVVHVSNILGTINPVTEIARRAHEVGALVLVDASQSAPHLPLDVSTLGADLVAFTGHKMCAPTGIGVLWGRREVLEALPPFLGGGEMIDTVTMESATYAALPHKYEAGTPPIAEAIGLGAAVTYLTGVGMPAIAAHEHQVTTYALGALAELPGLRIIGPSTPVDRGSAVSFVMDGIHPHDVGQLLDFAGVAVRVGHHCARPVCSRFGLPSTTRASFGLYTTTGEVDALVAGLRRVREVFG
ncbi:MAG: cysteine desulfurase [Actinomycetes bacterium]